MTIITLTDLANKNIHLGHNLEYWNPKTKKYIYKIINKICIIDIIQTAKYLSKAYSYLYLVGYTKQNILFIGSKKKLNLLIKKTAQITGNFYSIRPWIAGTLTNWKMIKSRLILLQWLFNLLNNSTLKLKLPYNIYLKLYKNYKHLNFKLKGLIGLQEIPEVIFILDPLYEKIALKEALKLNKIILSIIDTNINTNNILIPIPGNDDNYHSIEMILKILAAGYIHGIYYI